jgi:DNA replication protein DnaC
MQGEGCPEIDGINLNPERLTGALLDQLTHHAHILEMNGESFRLKHSRKHRKTKT